ncbi:subtilisin-like protein [Anaeromyces robustus]|uniref:Subtilisin-like protein n=1 Tax=Anaeromyces robustus TaxID=1754192 RepID=A0A1Y1X6N0_9FUNG|nr:subtilisin-like protein [Anaeromyces robustus]|eukprot:ORX81450.1 subtilisin-like protein [Anaeromyces robustus]
MKNYFFLLLVVIFNYFIINVLAENEYYLVSIKGKAIEYDKASKKDKKEINELVNDRMNDIYDVIIDNQDVYGKNDEKIEEINEISKLRKRGEKIKFKFINHNRKEKESDNDITDNTDDNNDKSLKSRSIEEDLIPFDSKLVIHVCPVADYYVVIAYIPESLVEEIKSLPNVISCRKSGKLKKAMKEYNEKEILNETKWKDVTIQENGLDFFSNIHLSMMSQGKFSFNSSLTYDNNYYYPSTAGKGIDIYVIDNGLDTSLSEENFDTYAGTPDERIIKCDGIFFDGHIHTVPNEKRCIIEYEGISITLGDFNHGTSVAISAIGTLNGVAKKANLHSLAIDYYTYDVLSAFDYIKQHAVPHKSIVNISSGLYEDEASFSLKEIQDKINELNDYGIIIIVAAGNENENHCKGHTEVDSIYNALDGVIIIGALNHIYYRYDSLESIYEKVDYSNYGECVDLFAPGGITVTNENNKSITDEFGTSFAAPFVSGLAATIMAENSDIKYNFESLKNKLIELSIKDVIKGLDNETPNRLANNGKRITYGELRCDDSSGKNKCGEKCCSSYGICVDSEDSDDEYYCYVDNGCQSEFGYCYDYNYTDDPENTFDPEDTFNPDDIIRICDKDNKCEEDECCSMDGNCVKYYDELCLIENGCQSEFGNCSTKKCGKQNGNRKCQEDECCSKDGVCVNIFSYNGKCFIENGCIEEYSDQCFSTDPSIIKDYDEEYQNIAYSYILERIEQECEIGNFIDDSELSKSGDIYDRRLYKNEIRYNICKRYRTSNCIELINNSDEYFKNINNDNRDIFYVVKKLFSKLGGNSMYCAMRNPSSKNDYCILNSDKMAATKGILSEIIIDDLCPYDECRETYLNILNDDYERMKSNVKYNNNIDNRTLRTFKIYEESIKLLSENKCDELAENDFYLYDFRWILRARCGYKIDARVAKAAKLVDIICPNCGPCYFHSYNSSFNNGNNSISNVDTLGYRKLLTDENESYLVSIKGKSLEYDKASERDKKEINELVNDRMNDIYDVIIDNQDAYGKNDEKIEEINEISKLRKRGEKIKFKFINHNRKEKELDNDITDNTDDNNDKSLKSRGIEEDLIPFDSKLVIHVCPVADYYVVIAYIPESLVEEIKSLPNVISCRKSGKLKKAMKEYNEKEILNETKWKDVTIQENELDYYFRNIHLSMMSQGKFSFNSSLTYDNNCYYPSTAGKGIDIYVIDTGLDTSLSEENFDTYAGTPDERIIKCDGIFFDGHIHTVPNEKRCIIEYEGVSITEGAFNHGTSVAISAIGTLNGVAKKANLHSLAIDQYTYDVLSALEYIKQHAVPHKSIVNISSGLYEDEAEFSLKEIQDKINELNDYGIIIIVAAGNERKNSCKGHTEFDSIYNALDGVIIIGALNNEDHGYYNLERIYERANYSNYGECVDLFAPGTVRITNKNNEIISNVSGTSFAAPFVSGLAATIMAENSDIKYNFESLKNKLIELSIKDVIKGLYDKTPNRLANNDKRITYGELRCDEPSGKNKCGEKCCSSYGICVDSEDYESSLLCFVENGCQSEFGNCSTKKCGKQNGNRKCQEDECCSKDGVCVNIFSNSGECFIENGCIEEYSDQCLSTNPSIIKDYDEEYQEIAYSYIFNKIAQCNIMNFVDDPELVKSENIRILFKNENRNNICKAYRNNNCIEIINNSVEYSKYIPDNEMGLSIKDSLSLLKKYNIFCAMRNPSSKNDYCIPTYDKMVTVVRTLSEIIIDDLCPYDECRETYLSILNDDYERMKSIVKDNNNIDNRTLRTLKIYEESIKLLSENKCDELAEIDFYLDDFYLDEEINKNKNKKIKKFVKIKSKCLNNNNKN